jgi:hypothetical protein
MAQEPGGLNQFGADAREAWDKAVADAFPGSLSDHLLEQPDPQTPDTAAVDWPAKPVRVFDCLPDADAERLLDWRSTSGDLGRLTLQEEYLEWRVVREDSGRIKRIEMTTEFPEYWEVLAAWQPQDALALVAEFAGADSVAPEEIYGDHDPFSGQSTPKARRNAFRAQMTGRRGIPPSTYNNGRDAICFMIQGANTLPALIHLVAAAASPLFVEDEHSGELRPMSGSEAIAAGNQAAVPCRNSDPTVVEKILAAACAGRRIALDDPIGIYIQSVQHQRLRQPDQSEVPAEWFEFGRGVGEEDSPDGRIRHQRLVFEVPAEENGLAVGDLMDVDGRKIEHGSQVADLVQLAAFARVGEEGVVEVDRTPQPLPKPPSCDDSGLCEEIVGVWRDLQEE